MAALLKGQGCHHKQSQATARKPAQPHGASFGTGSSAPAGSGPCPITRTQSIQLGPRVSEAQPPSFHPSSRGERSIPISWRKIETDSTPLCPCSPHLLLATLPATGGRASRTPLCTSSLPAWRRSAPSPIPPQKNHLLLVVVLAVELPVAAVAGAGEGLQADGTFHAAFVPGALIDAQEEAVGDGGVTAGAHLPHLGVGTWAAGRRWCEKELGSAPGRMFRAGVSAFWGGATLSLAQLFACTITYWFGCCFFFLKKNTTWCWCQRLSTHRRARREARHGAQP